MRRAWLAAVLLSLMAALPAFARESIQLDKVRELPVELRWVHRCGSWETPQAGRGHYRILVADVSDGAGSEFYLQWLSDPTPQQPSQLVATAQITELNEDHAQYEFLSATCERHGKASYLRALARFEHDPPSRVRTILVRLGEPGRYAVIHR